MVITAMATAIVRKKALRQLPDSAGGGACPNPQVLWLSAGLFILITLPASAQYVPAGPEPLGGKRGWEIHPTILAEEIYTDNVRLAPSGSARSDWVTRLSPGVSVSGTGARASFKAIYAPQVVYRAQEESNEIFHYLDAKGNAELLQQLLFLDAAAAITQQNFSLLRPQAESNVNDTGNRTEVRSYSVSPYLRRDLGYDAQGEMRLTHRAVSYGGNSLFNSQMNRADMRIWSGPAFKLLTWNLAYHKERLDYTQLHQNIDTEQISASGRRLITPNVGLRATAGYDNNHYVTGGREPKGAFWSVGTEWTPTPRTHLAVAAGRVYFGPTRFLDFSHRTRLTTWRVEYNQDVTTTFGQGLIPSTADVAGYLDNLLLSRIPDPAARQTAIDKFLTQTGVPPSLTVPLNFVTANPFLQKRWLASFGIQGARNTVLTNLFWQTRDVTAAGQAGAGDFSSSPSTRQTGGSLLWALRMPARTTSNLTLSYIRNEFPGLSRKDNLKSVYLAFTRELQPRLFVTLGLRRLQNYSNESGSGYTENAVLAGFVLRY